MWYVLMLGSLTRKTKIIIKFTIKKIKLFHSKEMHTSNIALLLIYDWDCLLKITEN
jgi:hypothetical protein